MELPGAMRFDVSEVDEDNPLHLWLHRPPP
jgi:hypothetical protein